MYLLLLKQNTSFNADEVGLLFMSKILFHVIVGDRFIITIVAKKIKVKGKKSKLINFKNQFCTCVRIHVSVQNMATLAN